MYYYFIFCFFFNLSLYTLSPSSQLSQAQVYLKKNESSLEKQEKALEQLCQQLHIRKFLKELHFQEENFDTLSKILEEDDEELSIDSIHQWVTQTHKVLHQLKKTI